MKKPRPKRKYKGHYYKTLNKAVEDFKNNGNLIELLDKCCNVVDTGVCYSWQRGVFDRELRDALSKISPVIVFADE